MNFDADLEMVGAVEVVGRGGGGRGGGGPRGGGGRPRGGGSPRGRGRRLGPRGWRGPVRGGPVWVDTYGVDELDDVLLLSADDLEEALPARIELEAPRRRRRVVLVGADGGVRVVKAQTVAATTPELAAIARAALAERKAAAGAVDAIANWLSGADKWGPLERELVRVEGMSDSPESRLRAATLCRSLGVEVALPGQARGDAQTDEGDAGRRAEAATVAAEVVDQARALARRASDAVPTQSTVERVLPWLVGGVVLAGVGAVAAPLAAPLLAARLARR